MSQAAVWLPYCGAAPVPAELAARWNLDPVLLAGLALGVWAWARFTPGGTTARWRFACAVALILILFVSPFCALTSALFSARTVHHLALTAVVAPLLAGALPAATIRGGAALWAAAHAVTFWFWHAPSAYETALSHHAVYWTMQGSLLLTAVGLWQAVRRASLPTGIAALLATMVQMGLLGALLTVAGASLYAPHALGPLAWGLTPLEDQQLAGLVMWAPGAALYLVAALTLAGRWFAAQRPLVQPA